MVAGTDGSLNATRAVDWAAREAVLRDTALDILYAVPDLDEAGPLLAAAVAREWQRHPGLWINAVPVVGDPARALADAGREAALTVVGSRGLGGLTGLLLGSVSHRLAELSHGPLLVVRGDRMGAPPPSGAVPPPDPEGLGAVPRPGNRLVLLGIEGGHNDGDDDDSDGTVSDAVVFAFQEAARRGAGLRVIHTGRARGSAPKPGTGEALARLRAANRRITVESRAAYAGPARTLLDATPYAEVVVIAVHHQRRRGRLVPRLSHTANALLHYSHCPVALVPVAAPSAPG